MGSRVSVVLLTVICWLTWCTRSWAAFSCTGSLTQAQAEGFEKFFTPPFGASLRNVATIVKADNYFKVLNRQQYTLLLIPEPKLASSTQLTEGSAAVLKKWLNENANATVPGWFTPAVAIFIPSAWVGLAVEAAVQLVNSKGEAGRITLGNVAGTVSAGGNIGITERIISRPGGGSVYVWSYLHTAVLNGKSVVVILRNCSADVAVQ